MPVQSCALKRLNQMDNVCFGRARGWPLRKADSSRAADAIAPGRLNLLIF
jgi:hypothetical protein